MEGQAVKSKSSSDIRLPVIKDHCGSHVREEEQGHTLLDCPREFGLPSILSSLSENRLDVVKQKVNQNRTLATLANRQIQFRRNTHQASIDKQVHILDAKHRRKSVGYKSRLLDLNGYKKCLRKHRDDVSSDTRAETLPTFGFYGGATFIDLKPKVEKIISDHHPKKRRQREATKMLHDGKQDGRLMDISGTVQRVVDLVERPFETFVWKGAEDKGITRFPPFMGRREKFALHRQNEEYFKLVKTLTRSVSVYAPQASTEDYTNVTM